VLRVAACYGAADTPSTRYRAEGQATAPLPRPRPGGREGPAHRVLSAGHLRG